jgi:hypothetical protein
MGERDARPQAVLCRATVRGRGQVLLQGSPYGAQDMLAHVLQRLCRELVTSSVYPLERRFFHLSNSLSG